MDIQKLTIGQMAQLNNVTTETLRHYDREDLLRPVFTDPKTGYRYYHINQCAKLDMIQYLQSCELPLHKIRYYLNLKDSDEICKMLQSQLANVETSIKLLKRSHDSIARMISNYKYCKLLPRDCSLFYEYMQNRLIFTQKTRINLFEEDISGYELMLRELKTCLVENKLPASYFCNVGTIIRQKHLGSENLYSDEVFFFVEKDYDGPGNLEILPESLYLCMCNDDFEKEKDCAQKLLFELKRSGYKPAGDYICEVIKEFPGFASAPRNIMYKIQIPVRR